MVSDLGYINARVRAMKGLLLQRDNYEELLRKDRFDTFFVYLQGLPSYSDDLRRMAGGHSQTKEALDYGLKNNLERTFRKIINFSGGRPRALILYILHRYDIYNLKTILRGIFYNVSPQRRLEACVLAGEWDSQFCQRLSSENSISGMRDALSHSASPWSGEVSSILRRFERNKGLSELEDSLERFYFEHCLSNLGRDKFDDSLVLEFLQCEVDSKNILFALRAIQGNSEIDKGRLLSQGRIPHRAILDAAQYKDIRKALEALAQACHKGLFSEPMASLPQGASLLAIERFIRRQLLHLAMRLYQMGPLNIGVVLGYLQMKEAEVINLRTLSYGLYYGLETSLLKSQLIQ